MLAIHYTEICYGLDCEVEPRDVLIELPSGDELEVSYDVFQELEDLEDHELLKVVDFWDNISPTETVRNIVDNFVMENDRENWIDYLAELMSIPEDLLAYMDWDMMIRDLSGDFCVTESYVFHNF